MQTDLYILYSMAKMLLKYIILVGTASELTTLCIAIILSSLIYSLQIMQHVRAFSLHSSCTSLKRVLGDYHLYNLNLLSACYCDYPLGKELTCLSPLPSQVVSLTSINPCSTPIATYSLRCLSVPNLSLAYWRKRLPLLSMPSDAVLLITLIFCTMVRNIYSTAHVMKYTRHQTLNPCIIWQLYWNEQLHSELLSSNRRHSQSISSINLFLIFMTPATAVILHSFRSTSTSFFPTVIHVIWERGAQSSGLSTCQRLRNYWVLLHGLKVTCYFTLRKI